MRVIISGPVTADHLADAELLAGITPTSYVTNGLTDPPRSNRLPVETYPVCPMQPEETRVRARNFTLAQNADALICVGENDHLVSLARNYDLLVYEVSE
jgi:hypothetical protein